MTETKTKRTFEAQTSINTHLHLAPVNSALPLEHVTPAAYARMNDQQRQELVNRLIEFLKSF